MAGWWTCSPIGLRAGAVRGSPVESTASHLRLAIRNAYLNFYRAGQSVAKVGFGRGGIVQASIHKKYVFGDACKEQGYVTLTSAGLKDGEGRMVPYDPEQLPRWIANASGKGGEEKEFVDLVIGRNPDVIDVEMGLPAYSDVRHAPRMDLVGIEPDRDRWKVVFWEAKLARDGRARCRGDGLPKVVTDQLLNYALWLDHGENQAIVAL
jgi:hypothetical protein